MNINDVDFEPLLKDYTPPNEPYMLFGRIENNLVNRKNTESPALAEFKLVGSLRTAGPAMQYIRKGFKLLQYSVPQNNAEYAELARTLESYVGLAPDTILSAEREKNAALESHTTELEMRVKQLERENKELKKAS